MTNKIVPIGITMGDPGGIGPEIIVRAFINKLPAPAIVYGNSYIMNEALKLVSNNKLKINKCNKIEDADFNDFYINVIDNDNYLLSSYHYGKVDSSFGQASYNYIVNAVEDALKHRIKAIVTAPINKESISKAGINFTGHTEFLAEKTNTKDFAMVMLNKTLKVLLVTVHTPLSNVSHKLSVELELTSIKLAYKACRQMGIYNPKIAVAALNPHCGEGGLFGMEEIEIIKPAVLQAYNNGINVSGPWPGDTIFMRANRGEFDIVVSQYHDQGIIPIKFIGIDYGINFTVGLPFIRTSVDHGTAFDIAWKGIASSLSLQSAFNLAVDMISS